MRHMDSEKLKYWGTSVLLVPVFLTTPALVLGVSRLFFSLPPFLECFVVIPLLVILVGCLVVKVDKKIKASPRFAFQVRLFCAAYWVVLLAALFL